MLRVRELEVRYADHVALAPVTFDQPGGTILAITGPSGAGKTSLLWGLCRAVTPTLGEVRVGETTIDHHDTALVAGVVLIPQGNGLARVLTAEENVLLPLRGQDRVAVAATALAAVGLSESSGHLVEELSGGQQQRVAVARGLAARSGVLLADEPTSELDVTNRDVVLGLLRAEAERGAIVVLATNDPEAAEVCDAHAVLDEGRLTWVRPLAATSD